MTTSRRFLMAVIATAAGCSLAPAAASAAVDCTFAAGAMDVDVTAGTTAVRLERAAGGTGINVYDATAAPTLVACGGPTVNTVDTIDIDDTVASQSTSFQLSLVNGPFEGGVTDEPGDSDEIEFSVDAGTGSNDRIGISPPSGDNNFRMGALSAGENGINLNGSEPDGVDSDVTAVSVDQISATFGAGNDVARGDGTGVAAGQPGSAPLAGTRLTVVGGQGNDTLTAGSGNNNLLEGGLDNDTLTGGPNTDTLYVGPGNDTADGGGGDDGASYIHETAPITLDLRITGPQDTGGQGTDALTGIENVYGTNGADTITGNSGPNQLTGGNLASDLGADTLIGLEGNDILWGAKGNDTLVGGPDNDSMVGGDGTDTISYATGSTGGVTASVDEALTGTVQPTGGAGNDTLGVDPLTAGAGHRVENITGSPFADTLTGGTAPNKLVGLGGVDTLTLGDNGDSFDAYDGGLDTVTCGSGTDSGTADEQGVDQLNECESTDHAPQTTVASGPGDGAATNDTTPTYELSSDEPATFQRSVDGGPFEPCAASCELPALANGQHTVAFRAIDADEAGLTELNPASRALTVEPPAPGTPDPGTGSTTGGTTQNGGGTTSGTTGGTTQNGGTFVTKASAVALRSAKVSRKRKATIGSVTCGSAACAIKPGSAKLKIGRKSFRVSALAPMTLAPGAKKSVAVSLSRSVYAKLRSARKGTLTVTLSSASGDATTPLTLKLRLTR